MRSSLALSIMDPMPHFNYFLSNYNVLFVKIKMANKKMANKKITSKYVKQIGANYCMEFSKIH